ncbi:MAG: squalene/phytoene synthase family protein [Chthoniobacter sp.]|uniref:phytoene/squalene synthase family protein n=1 Tax=Chthoniobacter sp. TaxID=2510640 RepID=UPI0032A17C1B
MAIHTKDLGGPLLASVSRSFYLSIRLLPRKLRAPIGLAYLLARASDTIADSAEVPEAARLQHLAAFARMIRTGRTDGLAELQHDIHTPHPGETTLLCNLDRCIAWLGELENKDRSEIVDVLEKIIRGQTLDLERFGGGHHVVALQSAEELEEYTYLVAGCVGEFWTRVCLNHLPGCSSLGLADLRKLGAEYGKGLQLVNILRDFPEDLRNGRCYFPEPELRAAGTSPTPLIDAPAKAQPVYDLWRERAIAQLDAGYEYIASLRSARLRAACFLPWYLGLRTLRLLGKPGTLDRTDKVKVSRLTVRFAFVYALASAFSERALAWSYRRATGHARPAPVISEESSSAASP